MSGASEGPGEAVKAKAKRSSNLFIELAQGKDKQTISSYEVRACSFSWGNLTVKHHSRV